LLSTCEFCRLFLPVVSWLATARTPNPPFPLAVALLNRNTFARGDPHQIGRMQTENCKRRTCSRPDFVKLQQVVVEERHYLIRMPARWPPADRETCFLPNEFRIRLFKRFTNQRCNSALINPVRTACNHQDRPLCVLRLEQK